MTDRCILRWLVSVMIYPPPGIKKTTTTNTKGPENPPDEEIKSEIRQPSSTSMR